LFKLQATAPKPANCLNLNGKTYLTFCNFWFSGGTGSNVTGSGNLYTIMCDCVSDLAGTHGFSMGSRSTLKKCIARNNSSCGIYTAGLCTLFGCLMHGNTLSGAYIADAGTSIIACLCYENTSHNVLMGYAGAVVLTTAHSSTTGSGLYFSAGENVAVLFNRVTGNARYGIETANTTSAAYADFNGYNGNVLGEVLNAIKGVNDVSMAANGYVLPGSDNYQLLTTAEMRRIVHNFDWDLVTPLNIGYFPAGAEIPTDIPAAAGGGTKSQMGELLGIKRRIY
jgi:hypothetical protein